MTDKESDEDYEIIIAEKIAEDLDVLGYMTEKYRDTTDENLKELIINTLDSYRQGDYDTKHKNKIIDWIITNECTWLEKIVDRMEKNDVKGFVDSIFCKMAYMKSKDKYKTVKSLLDIKKCREIFKLFKTSKTGEAEEKNGFFKWILTDNMIDDTNALIDTLSPLLDDKSVINDVVKSLYRILQINKFYSYGVTVEIEEKKCSSLKYAYCIFNIIISIHNRYFKDTTECDGFPRTDMIFERKDNLETRAHVLFLKGYMTFHNCFLHINNALSKPIVHCKQFMDKYKISMDIVENKEYMETVEKISLNKMSDYKYVNDDYIYSIIEYTKMVKNNDNITDMLLSVISNIKKNPNIRYYATSILDTKYPIKYSNKIIISLCTYISEVNFVKLLSPPDEYAHYIKIMSLLKHFASTYKIEDIKGNDVSINKINNTTIMNGIHHICTKNIEYIEHMQQHCAKIPKEYTRREKEVFKMMNGSYVQSFIDCVTASCQALVNLVKCVEDIDKLETEIMIPIMTLASMTLNILSDGKQPIYCIYEKNIEVKPIILSTFLIINTIKKNKNFAKHVCEYIKIVKEMLAKQQTQLPEEERKSLIEYFNNTNFEEIKSQYEDVPDEFRDPLMCDVINEPIMLPDTDLIFDASSIRYHLMTSKTNPYNRQPLTLEDLEQHNSRDDIKQKIEEYKNKFENWKISQKRKIDVPKETNKKENNASIFFDDLEMLNTKQEKK